jgi:hypothetical protein
MPKKAKADAKYRVPIIASPPHPNYLRPNPGWYSLSAVEVIDLLGPIPRCCRHRRLKHQQWISIERIQFE